MAGSVNKVILVGNLGRDPESRSFSNGGKAVKFSVATSERWNDRQSGDTREKTEWHNVVIYNDKLGEVAEKYLRKGSKVYLEGQLQTREYDDANGVKQRITEVVLQRFRGELTLLDSRGGGGDDYARDDFDAPGRSGSRAPAKAFGGGGGGGGGSFADDLDDDVPF